LFEGFKKRKYEDNKEEKGKKKKQNYEEITKLKKERSNMMQSCSCIEDKGKKRLDVN